MKTFVSRGATVPEVTCVCCNLCGKEVIQNEFGYFEDYVALKKNWGYHSPFDGEKHAMDLCVDCYINWTKDFEIPVDIECKI